MTVPATGTETPPAPQPPPPAPPAPPRAGDPPAAPAGAPAPPDPPPEPNWLPQRLGRERAQALKDAGFESAEAAKAAKAELETLKAAQESQRLATLSEVEREKEKAKKLETDLAAERAKFAALERTSQLNSACAQNGVKNTGYAAFLFDQARAADPNITADAALKAALADEQNRAALGAAVVPIVQVPTTDAAPPQPGGAPPQPGPGGNTFDALKANEADWENYKKSLQR